MELNPVKPGLFHREGNGIFLKDEGVDVDTAESHLAGPDADLDVVGVEVLEQVSQELFEYPLRYCL